MVFQNLSDRETQLLDLLVEQSGISVSDLSEQLQVSAVTVRNTLNALAEKGVIVRTWGGAAPAFHPEIIERGKTNTEAKSRIARHAASLVGDGASIMVEAGTTTAMLGKYLFGKREVHAVTNSMLFVPYARANPGLHLTVTGGEYRASTESMVGPITLAELERFHVGLAFIGTDGFTLKDGLSTHLVEGAEIVKQMSIRADRSVLLADSSKYGRRGFVQVLALAEIDTLITDTKLPQTTREELAEAGVEVVAV